MTTPLTNESMHRLADIIADQGDAPLSRAVKAAFPLPSPQSDQTMCSCQPPEKGLYSCRHCGGLPHDSNPPTLPPPNFKENACQTPQASSLPSSSASQSSSGSSSSATRPAPAASPADAEPKCPYPNVEEEGEYTLQQIGQWHSWNRCATAWRQHTANLRQEIEKFHGVVEELEEREANLHAELERVKGERDAARKVGRTLFQIAQQLVPKDDGENREVTRAQ